MLKCPNCGTPEKTRVKVCHSCGEAFANEDMLELQKLEFLVEETSGWDVPEKLRYPYLEQLKSLKDRLVRISPVPVVEEIPEPEVLDVVVEAPLPAAVEAAPLPQKKPAPPKEKVPFDQWLLSTRNINIALYTGGLLLILAGLIFIGVNWTRIPGLWKFAITLVVTGLMYLGGILLFRRPAFRIGGVALTAIASGFFTLNFAVLQIYVLAPLGLRNEVMWLIASAICLPLYGLITYLVRSMLFTFYTQAAVISIATSALVVFNAPALIYLLVYALLSFGFLYIARLAKTTPLSDISHRPFLILSNIGLPVTVLVAIFIWLGNVGCVICQVGNLWIAIPVMGIGVVYYLLSNPIVDQKIGRWIAAPLLALMVAFILYQADLRSTLIGIGLLVLSLLFLGGGYLLEKEEKERNGVWPLYVTAYLVAAYVTQGSFANVSALIKALFGDVLILALSAVIFLRVEFVFGAAWLLMIPVYLLLGQYYPSFVPRGLFMGGLGLIYIAAGYLTGKKNLKWGTPFLTAAAFLSVAVVGLVWQDPLITSIILLIVAVLYLLIGLWLGWPLLLPPSLFSLNLGVFTLIEFFYRYDILLSTNRNRLNTLLISYLVLGIATLFGGFALQQRDKKRWTWPLNIAGVINLAGAYLLGLAAPDWLASLISGSVGLISLIFAWIDREEFKRWIQGSLLSYLGLLILFGSQYFLFNIIGGSVQENWPIYSAGICTLMVFLAWVLNREPWTAVFSIPLRFTGLILFIVPLMGISILGENIPGAITLLITGFTYTGIGFWRRKDFPILSYLGLILLFGSQYYLFNLIGGSVLVYWPVYSSVVCAFLVFMAWVANREPWIPVFSTPLRFSGLILFAVPLIGALVSGGKITGAITFLVTGLVYTGIGFWRKDDFPILTYLGLGILFGSQYYLFNIIGGTVLESWPVFSALVCILYIVLGRLMDRDPFIPIFSKPLLYAGVVLSLVPLIGAVVLNESITGLITFFAAGALLISIGFWRKNASPLDTYLGLGILFGSQYYLFQILGDFVLNNWPVFTVIICGFYVLLAWIMDREPNQIVFSDPLRISGLILSMIPSIASLIMGKPGLGSIVFTISSIILLGVGLWKKSYIFCYLSTAGLVVAIIELLLYFDVAEYQAYIIPVGLALIGVGWNENRRGSTLTYQIPTYLGLLLMMGSALVQSLPRGEYLYAILLGCECILAVVWGIYKHLRGFVQLGIIILFVNAIVQFGPGFVDLPRWIQIGVTGTILLGGGLAALFKREEILSIRRNLTDEMKSWDP